MKKLFRKLVLFIFQTKVYAYLMKYVIPYIRFNMYYTSFKGWKYHRGYKLLQPGDIILTLDKWKLTTLLIPGVWTHAALCVDKDSEFEVAEMTRHDFTKSTFFDICKESTRVKILRCHDFSPAYTKLVIERCLSFEDATYDVAFDYGIKALYCSELVYQADFARALKIDDSDMLSLGLPYVSPDDLDRADNCTM